MRAFRSFSALALLVLLPACATAGGGSSEGEARGDETVSVEVNNYNWRDMHVYVVAGGQRFSLGIVVSQNTETYDLPRSALASDRELVFMADPVGSVLAFLSDPVLVQPGDHVEWTIQNRLSHSGIFIR